MFLQVVCLCGLRARRREKIEKEYCMSLRTAMIVFVKCRRSESKCFFRLYVFADCGYEDKEKIEKEYCMSLRTAMIVFIKCRRYDSKCFFRSYVFADCGHEDKRRSKSNIVCVCGLPWLCLVSVGDLKVNVSKGRMSLWTAATKTREDLKAILYVFADCHGCVW